MSESVGRHSSASMASRGISATAKAEPALARRSESSRDPLKSNGLEGRNLDQIQPSSSRSNADNSDLYMHFMRRISALKDEAEGTRADFYSDILLHSNDLGAFTQGRTTADPLDVGGCAVAFEALNTKFGSAPHLVSLFRAPISDALEEDVRLPNHGRRVHDEDEPADQGLPSSAVDAAGLPEEVTDDEEPEEF